MKNCTVKLIKEELRFQYSQQGRGFLFNERTGEIFSLNKTGAFIVDRLWDSVGVRDLISEFASAFNISEQRAAADVSAFVGHLHEVGLIGEEAREK